MQDFQPFPAPAKVNLFLHVTGRRADGYHLLQSVFRLVDFNDTILLRPRQDGVIARSKEMAGVPESQDLTIRAAQLLKQHTGSQSGVDIAVEKSIPMGGGLGGGSSDAATVLIALNKLWDLNLSRQELMDLGLKLGADVPFFIFGKNAWVEGIGEKIQEIALPPAHYVILTPKIHVSTAQVFSAEELTRSTIPTTIAAFSGVFPEKEKQQTQFRNDLEPVVCQRYPAVASCLSWLNQFSQARMSGSGASVFIEIQDSLLDEKNSAKVLAKEILDQVPPEIAGTPIFAYETQGLEQHPLYNLLND
ncbi:MAG TPA: 4-(cytidine 5'-diphospho)-2-C-methyl-D-erythritol kinase [Methylophilaceae bacterium]|nr:4-(cytidine 5'-diphospho)-2-C-methyl-D-erythritol kinase [Methylophilaceae bacterium]